MNNVLRSIVLLLVATGLAGGINAQTLTDMGIRQQDDATIKWWMDANPAHALSRGCRRAIQ